LRGIHWPLKMVRRFRFGCPVCVSRIPRCPFTQCFYRKKDTRVGEEPGHTNCTVPVPAPPGDFFRTGRVPEEYRYGAGLRLLLEVHPDFLFFVVRIDLRNAYNESRRAQVRPHCRGPLRVCRARLHFADRLRAGARGPGRRSGSGWRQGRRFAGGQEAAQPVT
jgi:hypothetical protein